MPFPRQLIKEWGKKRGWVCEKCGRKWRDGWILEAHHRIPSSLGGQDTEDNCKFLCQGCHFNAHKAIEIGARVSAQLIKQRLDKTNGRWRE